MLNRTEQKGVIKDIIVSITNVKTQLQGMEDKIIAVEVAASELENRIGAVTLGASFEITEFKENFYGELLETELNPIYDEIYDLQSEVEEYISELSVSRAEVMEEKYAELDTVLEYFDQSSNSYDNLEDVYENMDEAISLLKEML